MFQAQIEGIMLVWNKLLIALAISTLAIRGFAPIELRTEEGKVALPKAGAKPVGMPGLHNVIHVTDKLYNGSSPEEDAGFDSLKKLGIKTILSVDGAKPDVVRARKFGLQYVHLPIGYDGVSQEQAMKLAKAVRDLPGPIYLHCHHGKHRSPGAAAAIVMCLDKECTAAKAIDIMTRAGTDPRYIGLFNAPNLIKKPSKEQLDKVAVEYVEAVTVPPLASSMVQIDHQLDNLTLIRKSGWKVPKDHPDLDPPHEALQLMEHYVELGRQESVQKRPIDFRYWLKTGEDSAKSLEDLLRKSKTESRVDFVKIEKSFQAAKQSCTQCHAKYRDVPQAK